MKKRGQGAFEFVGLTSVMLVMFILFFAIINDKIVDYQEQKNFRRLQQVGDIMKKEVELALKAEPGYIRAFELPPLLESKNYSILLQKGNIGTNIIIQYVNFSLDIPYVVKLPKDVFGKEIKPGVNIIFKNQSAVSINEIPTIVFYNIQNEGRKEFLGEQQQGGQIGEEGIITRDLSQFLVAYWKFDEGSDTQALDSSGNGNTGRLLGGSISWPIWVEGKYGKALEFYTFNDVVNVLDSDSLKIANQLTIEMWIKLENTQEPNKAGNLLYKGGTAGYNTAYKIVTSHQNKVIFGYGNGTHSQQVESVKNIPADTWTHITATADGNKIRIYMNGELDKEENQNLYITKLPWGVSIGQYVRIATSLDEIKIYNTTLSAEEIQRTMS